MENFLPGTAPRLVTSPPRSAVQIAFALPVVQPIFGKDTTNRTQYQKKSARIFFCIAEVPSIFYKDTTNRTQYQKKNARIFFCIAEVQSIFYKDTTRNAVKFGENPKSVAKRSF
ncbi:MAG: hypothetical protein ACI4BC_02585 [Muribaculaceae bacterium]